MISVKQAITVPEVLKDIKESTAEELQKCGILMEMKSGQHLFRDKDEVNTVYFVIDGMVTLYKINSIGERKVIFAYGKGSMLNEVALQGLQASASCEILKQAVILAFPKRRFLQLMEHDFRLNKAVMDSMALKIRRLYRQLKNTTNAMLGEKRLAAKLWKLSRDHGAKTDQGVVIQMDLTITYLADMMGSKRETVSRQIKKLSEKGLLFYEKNRFTIPDPVQLNQYFKQDE